MSEKKKEKVTLTEEEKARWDEWKEKATEELIPVAMSLPVEKIEYFIRTGIIRALDQRHGTAAKKLAAVEAKIVPDLFDLIPKGTEKQQLIRNLVNKQSVLTREMLQKLSIEQLRDLNNKF